MSAASRAKAVAVVVHNDVKRDARVLKEARSLGKAGLDVTVFGISDRAESWTQDGVTIRLIPYRNPLMKRSKDKLLRNQRALAAVLAVAAAVMIALLAPVALRNPGPAVLLVLLLLALAGLAYLFRGALLQLLLMVYRFYNWHLMARLLETTVAEGTYDAVHSHDVIGLIAGSWLKKRRPNLYLIWDAHEIYEQQGRASRLHSLWLRALLKRHSRDVDAFITINDSIKAFYQQQYRLPPALVVMNATIFAGAVADDGRLRRAAGLGGERKILLFHGGFAEHRGIPQLMEAARGLPQPWSIVMMGWGKAEPALKALAGELEKIHGRERAPLVVLPPVSQAELPTWIAGANLGVVPYEDVGLNHLYCTPNKLWEYPNAGVPILATALVEMEKMIEDWDTGFLLPRDFSGSDIIQTLNGISERALQEKRAKCLDFSQRLSWQVFEDTLLKAYDGA